MKQEANTGNMQNELELILGSFVLTTAKILLEVYQIMKVMDLYGNQENFSKLFKNWFRYADTHHQYLTINLVLQVNLQASKYTSFNKEHTR